MSGVISDNTVRSSGAVAPLSAATLDANDPAVDTNPTDGLGTKWVNTTSGQIFICIDATTDANQWIGQTTTSIQPRVFCAGGNKSITGHAGVGKINTIEYIKALEEAIVDAVDIDFQPLFYDTENTEDDINRVIELRPIVMYEPNGDTHIELE